MAAPRPWIDVRRSRLRWTRARIPAAVRVEGRELVVTVSGWRELSKKDRAAVQRLFGGQALGRLRAGEEAVLRVPLQGADVKCPTVPLLGRTGMRIRRQGEPDFAISWLDTGEVEGSANATGVVSLGAIARMAAGGPAGRRARNALRDEIARARG